VFTCVSSIDEIIEQMRKQVISTVLNKPNELANENNILSSMQAIEQANSLFQKGKQEELFADLGCLESFESAKKVDGSKSVMSVSFSRAGNYSVSFERINESLSNYLNYLGVTFILKFL
jgi:prephenate dehydratase